MDAERAARERRAGLADAPARAPWFPSPGVELIAAERQRQIESEGWSDRHDDGEHQSGELVHAAISYALHPFSDERHGPDYRIPAGEQVPRFWPWDEEWWKPTPRDRVRELTKAGALIAAEIDRLNRVKLKIPYRAAHSQSRSAAK